MPENNFSKAYKLTLFAYLKNSLNKAENAILKSIEASDIKKGHSGLEGIVDGVPFSISLENGIINKYVFQIYGNDYQELKSGFNKKSVNPASA